MPGKDPHRPEGKKGADEWHRRQGDILRNRQKVEDVPTEKDRKGFVAPHEPDIASMGGGQRPGVKSRMAEAMDARAERGADRDEGT